MESVTKNRGNTRRKELGKGCGRKINWGKEGLGFSLSDHIPPQACLEGYNAWHCRGLLVLMLLLLLLLGALVICRLEPMQSHANSWARQVVHASSASGLARPHPARPDQSCTSHAVTLLLNERERERERWRSDDRAGSWKVLALIQKMNRSFQCFYRSSIVLTRDRSVCALRAGRLKKGIGTVATRFSIAIEIKWF